MGLLPTLGMQEEKLVEGKGQGIVAQRDFSKVFLFAISIPFHGTQVPDLALSDDQSTSENLKPSTSFWNERY